MNWYSKKHGNAYTTTYSYEFFSTHTRVEHIIDLRHTLKYLGLTIRHKRYMFGDKKYVVDSSIHLHAHLHKYHTVLSFHRVREDI